MKVLYFTGLIHVCLLTAIGSMILFILPCTDPFDSERYEKPKCSKIKRRRKHGYIVIATLIIIEVLLRILK